MSGILPPKSIQHAPADYRFRPERPAPAKGWLDKLWQKCRGVFELGPWRYLLRKQKFVKRVHQFDEQVLQMSDEALQTRARELGQLIRQHNFKDALVAEVFAIIRETSGRQLGMRHFDSQLIGGWVMLQGRIAEMRTGEGKTLTAVLPVTTMALAGVPVHVISVNDYLVQRDAEEMMPVYQNFGLTVGIVTHEVDPNGRRLAYANDITYVTGKELVFDYLRDRMKLVQSTPLRMEVETLKDTSLEDKIQLRGLHFALVDEADSVLIDESRTPLIISGTQGNEEQNQFIMNAFEIAQTLEQGQDYTLDKDRREIEFTEYGQDHLQQKTRDLGPLWKGAIRREEIVHKALMAILIYERDKDYLIREGKVELIDPLSGRVMEGRSWEGGLHQMVELKEGCELTEQRVTMARISYQNFFRRYLTLSGMTGTGTEVKQELWNVYALAVSKVPSNSRVNRQVYSQQIYQTEAERWQKIVERCQQLVDQGRCVLIGTDSVANSEIGSQYLHQAKIHHEVLSAKQDQAEADIVAQAGQPSKVTIATSMAGRGTDIKLHESVKAAGGLHVIQTQLYESSRVDRQLEGRCARQADPGSYEMILTIEDQPIRTLQAKSLVTTAESLGVSTIAGKKMAIRALRTEQEFIEKQNYLARQSTLEYDLKLHELLAITGPTH